MAALLASDANNRLFMIGIANYCFTLTKRNLNDRKVLRSIVCVSSIKVVCHAITTYILALGA